MMLCIAWLDCESIRCTVSGVSGERQTKVNGGTAGSRAKHDRAVQVSTQGSVACCFSIKNETKSNSFKSPCIEQSYGSRSYTGWPKKVSHYKIIKKSC